MGSLDRLIDRLRTHGRVALDTNILIYFLENMAPFHAASARILRQAERGHCQFVISTVTEMELMVKPLRSDRIDHAARIAHFLTDLPNLEVIPVTRSVAHRAAQVRARTGLKTPDAVIAATAIEAGCSALLGNDRAFAGIAPLGLEFLCLNELLV